MPPDSPTIPLNDTLSTVRATELRAVIVDTRPNSPRDQNTARRNILDTLSRDRIFKWLFWYNYGISIVQIVAVSVTLGLNWGSPDNDKNLVIFLILLGVYSVLNFACNFYYHYNHVPLDPTTWNYVEPTSRTGHFFKRYHSTFVVCSVSEMTRTMWFLLNIYGMFSIAGCPTCEKKCPSLYYLTVALVAYNGFIMLLPFVAFMLFICCLPFMLIVARQFVNPNEMAHPGASQETIDLIPTFTYAVDKENVLANGVRVLPEDAKCTICLAQYREGEDLRCLACRHHFHKSCVDEWFRISATCPLCVTPIDASTSRAGV